MSTIDGGLEGAGAGGGDGPGVDAGVSDATVGADVAPPGAGLPL